MSTLEETSNQFFSFRISKERSDIDCLERALRQFCKTGKKSDAFSVYYCFCEIFEVFGKGYGSMNRLLEFLFDHEYHSGGLITKHRDHYSHSVYVFALGLAIYANDASFRKEFLDFYKKDGADDTSFLRLWGLTALFHDIGYPFQLAHEQIKEYTKSVWGEDNPVSPYVSYENFDPLLKIECGDLIEKRYSSAQNVGELLAFGIHERLGYPMPLLLSMLCERYKHQRKFMDHGYYSAVLLFYQLKTTGTKFSDQILDVLTAIALHNNLNRYDIHSALDKNTAIPSSKHPLAYLLVLCDELQDWDRTAFGFVSKKDPLAWKIELSVFDKRIELCYVFDSFHVIDTAVCVEGCGEAVTKPLRENDNYTKILSGKFVNEILQLVQGKLVISASAREERKNKKTSAFASSESFINLCDFAYAIHRSYQRVHGGKDFDELSLEFRLANIEQAKSYADKLELINCFYSEKELDYPVVTGFGRSGEQGEGLRADMNFLAREEHLRWVREKLDAGWKYGTEYSTKEERDAKKIHKDIIPFDCLSEEDKQKDELMIKNMVPFLYHYGHGVRIYNYRAGRKPVLDIAACGHRTIRQSEELKDQIKAVLKGYSKKYRVVVRTNFAFGADQLVAECANEMGITIKAALPLPYEEYIALIREDAKQYGYPFTEEDVYRMRHLLAQTVSCKVVPDEKYVYLEASKYIINKCKKMIALWDGVETILEDEEGNPINQGGTWHNICIAKKSRGLTDEDIHIIKCER